MDPLGFGHLGRPQWSSRGGPPGPSTHLDPSVGPPIPALPISGVVDGEEAAGAEVGSKCDVKQVYGTPNPLCQCCTVWEDELPGPDNSAKIRKADKERDTYAVVRRRIRHSAKMEWKTHSVDINSPMIRSKLEVIFAEYLSVDISATDLSFQPPFVPFIHKWEALNKIGENETDAAIKQHLKLLIELLEPEVKESFEVLARVNKTGYISFPWLSVAFVPGETVLHISDSVVQAGVLREVNLIKPPMGASYYEFRVDILDSDGESIGVSERTWNVQEFKGRRHISNLEVCPMHFYPKHEELEKTLIIRGKVFESLQGQHLRFYLGKGSHTSVPARPSYPDDMFMPPPQAKTKFRPLRERIIVDIEGYYNLQGECPPKLRLRKDLGRESEAGIASDETDDPTGEVEAAAVTKNATPLSDYEYMLASSQVKGFALKTKIWCSFYVTEIRDIVWVPDAMEKLVLEREEKALLLAITSNHQNDKPVHFDDFIPNKGKGIIILLSGPPGVGKTLTAEAVAEKTKRPLYRLGAGDLGTTVSAVEQHLQEALQRCAYWNAVLLIDEVDVFLEERSTNDLDRNELVSTFLRLLEYYEGIMILTTNRISSIDPAFESRIDISLAYRNLDQAARAQVWRGFIQSIADDSVQLEERDVEILAEAELNGRQIKSAIKTACILAQTEGSKLGLGHLQTVLKVREKASKLIGSGANGRC